MLPEGDRQVWRAVKSPRFFAVQQEANAAEPLEMVRVVKDAVDAFTGSAPRADDVAALALRWQPAEAAAARPIEWAGA
jgi:hypothetical protein